MLFPDFYNFTFAQPIIKDIHKNYIFGMPFQFAYKISDYNPPEFSLSFIHWKVYSDSKTSL
jgi:hypothetical protein